MILQYRNLRMAPKDGVGVGTVCMHVLFCEIVM